MVKKIKKTTHTILPEILLNCLFIYILSAILLGAFSIQFFAHEQPCPLCLLQRIGMIGMASAALMNCKFGPKRSHYGIALLFAIFGGFVALRQIALHACPGSPTFGIPFWGLSLYTWSFITFCSSVLFIALMFVIFNNRSKEAAPKKFDAFGWTGFVLLIVLASANCIYSLYHCGLGPCEG